MKYHEDQEVIFQNTQNPDLENAIGIVVEVYNLPRFHPDKVVDVYYDVLSYKGVKFVPERCLRIGDRDVKV